MKHPIEPVWVKWPSQDDVPKVGEPMDIHEQPIRDDDGVEIGAYQLDPPSPGIVERIGAHWSCQLEGRSGYWMLLRPREAAASRCDKCGEVITDLDAGFSPAAHGMEHKGCGGTWRVDQ
jgi:hypothetical protein